ncbi:hypothetical protein ACOQFO_09555 [Ureibacillus sp. MALMAid1270]|uniref:hypothetical protein n=1 Tax=Ureibacillus sp. MALMAid1270 TaxID=3411629 RepID=UPI003BA4A351
MKYFLLFIGMLIIVIRFHWYVRNKKIKCNLLRYSVFSIVSSLILAILHMNAYDMFDDGVISKDEWVSLSAYFTAYMLIAIFYPILRNTIDKNSN